MPSKSPRYRGDNYGHKEGACLTIRKVGAVCSANLVTALAADALFCAFRLAPIREKVPVEASGVAFNPRRLTLAVLAGLVGWSGRLRVGTFCVCAIPPKPRDIELCASPGCPRSRAPA